jgi:glycine/serine hydroxymethyltransferase
MAITLSVTLTDQEQAKLVEIANIIAPNMTGPQLKVWAEKHAKIGLREIVQRRFNDYQQQSLDNAWPVEQLAVPPQTP